MMITLKENTASSLSQPIDYNSNMNNRSYSTIGYDYHHQNSWEKPTYPSFNYPQNSYPLGAAMSSSTGGIPSLESTNKFNASFHIPTNLSHSTSNFYRRHTESALPTSTSIYTPNHPSSTTFNYSQPTATAHYHPPDLFFGWNHNNSSLIRTHSTSFQDYPQSSSYSCYNPTSLSTMPKKPMNSSYLNDISQINFSLPPPLSIPTKSKSSISPKKKRPRLTAHLRNEILKIKAMEPTAFAWEIRQTLLQNGICTAQTLPTVTVIQRVLNQSSKTMNNNNNNAKDAPKYNMNLFMNENFNNNNNNASSSVTICLSPSQSPSVSENEAGSECSICLETYRSGQEVSILSCSHEYHSTCIKEWMIKNRSCPMCRKDIHNQPQFVTLLI